MITRHCKLIFSVGVAALLAVTLAPSGRTQPGPDGRGNPDRTGVEGRKRPDAERGPKARKAGGKEKARRRLARLRQRVLRKKVGLSDAKIEKVTGVMKSHQAKRIMVNRQIRASRRAIGQLLRADSDDQRAFAKHLEILRSRYRDQSELRDQQIQELGAILTPIEQAKLYRAMAMVKRRFESERLRMPKRRR